MGLSNIQIPTETFDIRGASVTLRGICFDDLAYILEGSRGEVDAAISFAQAKMGESEEPVGSTQAVITDLLRQFPALAAKIIACAADEPEAAPTVRKLPFPMQLDMAAAVARLTFEEVGGVKKFLERVIELIREGRSTLSALVQTN